MRPGMPTAALISPQNLTINVNFSTAKYFVLVTIDYMTKPKYKLASERDSRLNTSEFRTLASEIRSRRKHDNAAAESVAAALESVSMRRARRPGHNFREAAIALFHQMTSRLLTIVDRVMCSPPLGRTASGHPNQADRPAPPARPSTQLRRPTIDLSPSALEQAFWSVANGCGIQSDLCEALIRDGWAKWVDRTNFAPVNETHPGSLLIMTPAGEQQYAELCTMAAH